jgi:peptidoglycan/xylan/chitin deacetylase (PgdA/CDA1 family)
MAVGAAITLVLLVVAVASAFSSGTPRSTPGPTRIADSSRAAATPTATITPVPTWTPLPSSALPRAVSLPVIRSCDPASVPGALAVTTPPVGRPGTFVLKVPVLMYHRIVPFAQAGNSIHDLVVPPETFSAQLDALESAGWHTITMARLASDLQAHSNPSAKTFVITIDDGWDDGYTYALPILMRHSFVATYFVIASRIDAPQFLSSIHLRALIAAGDEIGDHTMDHVNLARSPAANLHFEIDAAAARIAQVTGRWPESFAYPHGGVNNAAVAAVAACGELRTAVIEEVMVSGSASATAPSSKPAARPSAQPSGMPISGASSPAVPSRASSALVPLVRETWSDRWMITRLSVGPNTKPAGLVAEVAPYQ